MTQTETPPPEPADVKFAFQSVRQHLDYLYRTLAMYRGTNAELAEAKVLANIMTDVSDAGFSMGVNLDRFCDFVEGEE